VWRMLESPLCRRGGVGGVDHAVSALLALSVMLAVVVLIGGDHHAVLVGLALLARLIVSITPFALLIVAITPCGVCCQW